MPKAAHGSVNIPGGYTSSVKAVMDAAARLYDSIVDPDLLVRRIYIVANHTLPEGSDAVAKASEEQLDIFTAAEAQDQGAQSEEELKAERSQQEAVLAIRKKYGKNAIVRGMDLQEAATAMERNAQVGGHKA